MGAEARSVHDLATFCSYSPNISPHKGTTGLLGQGIPGGGPGRFGAGGSWVLCPPEDSVSGLPLLGVLVVGG